MPAPPTEASLRLERKFVVEGVSLPEIIAAVRLHPALFFAEFPPRNINNLYFDTADFRHYRQNIDGNTVRAKARIRWYGNLFGPVRKPILEIKRKQGVLGTKDAIPLSPFSIGPGFAGREAVQLLRAAALPPELRCEVEDVEPVLLNRYRRQYFRSADRILRLTLDSQLEFYRVQRHQNSFLHRSEAGRFVIMEIKYRDDAHDVAAQAVNELPFRLARMSKYVLGINRLHHLE